MRIVLCAVAVLGAACAPQPPVNPAHVPEIAIDTLLGIVREVGADPATMLVLEPAGGVASRADVPLHGDSARAMRSVAGAVVWVRGQRRTDGMVVREFEVRSVNGVPVDDGMLMRATDGVGLELQMRSGMRRAVSADVARLVGERLWITRAVPGRAPSYGVIRGP